MARKLFLSIALLATLSLAFPLAAQAVPVDTQLMLVIDVSGSISTGEYNLMMQGYGEAFRDPGVQNAILGGNHGSIVVGLVFFATDATKAGTGFYHLSNTSQIEAFADLMWNDTTNNPFNRPYAGGSATDVQDGIDLASSLGVASGFEAERFVMDVSGDGVQNEPGNVVTARNNALSPNGIYDVINGISIGNGDQYTSLTALLNFYDNQVIGGDGAFHVHTNDFNTFGSAIRGKLALEIAGTPEPGTLLLFGSAAGVLGFWRRRRNKKI